MYAFLDRWQYMQVYEGEYCTALLHDLVRALYCTALLEVYLSQLCQPLKCFVCCLLGHRQFNVRQSEGCWPDIHCLARKKGGWCVAAMFPTPKVEEDGQSEPEFPLEMPRYICRTLGGIPFTYVKQLMRLRPHRSSSLGP
jgi:hypothetical protein